MCGTRLDEAPAADMTEWSPRRLQLAGLLDRARFAAGYLQTRSRVRRQLGVIDAELRRLGGERRNGVIALGEATYGGDEEAAAEARERIRAVDERIQQEREKQRQVVEDATSSIEREHRSVAATRIVDESDSSPEEPR
jgi:SOS response regulatory protein OraA/RecX